jgi:YD repeat-containing protein
MPALGSYNGTSSANRNEPTDPVTLPGGVLAIHQDDLVLQSPGFPTTAQRLYLSERKNRLGPFGYGWLSPYEHRLQMFAGFNMVEYRPDGSQIKYTFTPADASQYTDSFDGDRLIYYNLDQGIYKSDEPFGSTLQRISATEYRLTTPTGTVYTFKGYSAKWRAGEDQSAGKLLSVADRNGNQTDLGYDNAGHLTSIKDSVGRQTGFGFTGDRVTTMTDPLGRVTQYAYDDAQNLVKAVHPDGRELTFTYDAEHRLTGMTKPEVGSESFSYSGDRVT